MDANPHAEDLEEISRRGCRAVLRSGTIQVSCSIPDPKRPGRKKQTYLRLHQKPDFEGFQAASKLISALSLQLRHDRFDPADWTKEKLTDQRKGAPEGGLSWGDFAAMIEALYDRKYPINQQPKTWATSWGKKYKPLITMLSELRGSCTEESMFWAIKTVRSDSSRKSYASIVNEVVRANRLPWDKEQITEAGKGYVRADLKPRDIPTEVQIAAALERIKVDHWRFMFLVLWLFGIRPHEIVGAKITPMNARHILQVPDQTKTGFREVWPQPYEAFAQHKLHMACNQNWPSQSKYEVAKAFGDYVKRVGIGFPAYNLRHAYALRLFVLGVPIDRAAKLMGHTPKVHEDTYKHWITRRHMQQMHQAEAALFD